MSVRRAEPGDPARLAVSEDELGAQLDKSRIACPPRRPEAGTVDRGVEPRAEVVPVPEVENVGPQLEPDLFLDVKSLGDCQVLILVAIASQFAHARDARADMWIFVGDDILAGRLLWRSTGRRGVLSCPAQSSSASACGDGGDPNRPLP